MSTTKGLFARGIGITNAALSGLFARGLTAAAATATQRRQRLLDSTAETISVAERLRFLRKIEDSLTPVVYIDRQGIKHLVHISRVELLHPTAQINDLEELDFRFVAVDAGEGRWPQPRMRMRVAVDVSAGMLTTTGGGLLLQDLTPLLLED